MAASGRGGLLVVTIALQWLRALQVVEALEIDLGVEHASPDQRKLLNAVTELGGSANSSWMAASYQHGPLAAVRIISV